MSRLRRIPNGTLLSTPVYVCETCGGKEVPAYEFERRGEHSGHTGYRVPMTKEPCHVCGKAEQYRRRRANRPCEDCYKHIAELEDREAKRAAQLADTELVAITRAWFRVHDRSGGDIGAAFDKVVKALALDAPAERATENVSRSVPRRDDSHYYTPQRAVMPRAHADALINLFELIGHHLHKNFELGRAEGNNVLFSIVKGDVTIDQLNREVARSMKVEE